MATNRTTPRSATERPTIIDIYCRISRDYDGTLRSVEAQEEACRAAIAAHAHEGWEAGKVFRDHALSAWNPKVHRPDFDELMTRLESGEADGVIVRNLDRFTRKMIEGERLLNVAKQGRIVVALDGRYDLGTARGQKNFYEDLIDAQYESHRLSERTVRGKRDKAARGKSNASYRGFAMPGFLPNPEDWETGDPRIEVPQQQLDAERDAVREVARRVLAGQSWASIVRWLNGTGLRTAYGNEWSVTSLRNMLRRPSLAGINTHHGEEVGVLPGEPVLDRETWERMVAVMAARTPGRQPSGRYLLTNLLYCGRCGHRLTGRPQRQRAPYPETGDPELDADRTPRQYWCQKQAGPNSGCGRLNVDQRMADAVVEEMVKATLGDPRHADRLKRRAAKVRAERDKVSHEISRLEEDAEALASKVATWGIQRVDAAMRPIDARLQVLRGKLLALDDPDADTNPSEATEAAAEWDNAASGEHRRAMVRRAFPRGITVLPTQGRGRQTLDGTRRRFVWER